MWKIIKLNFNSINFICSQIKFKLIVNYCYVFVIIDLKGGEKYGKIK